LVRFYPTTENNDLGTNRIDRQSLRATVLSIKEGVARARLSGSLRMKHAFYPGRADNLFVEASLLGYLDFEVEGRRIRTLRLITDQATYGDSNRHFGAALRSVAAK
jgi:hypothetical protein